jgi:hypothetical protein
MASPDIGEQIELIESCEHKRSTLTFSRFQQIFYGAYSDEKHSDAVAEQFVKFKSNFIMWFTNASAITKTKYLKLVNLYTDMVKRIDQIDNDNVDDQE